MPPGRKNVIMLIINKCYLRNGEIGYNKLIIIVVDKVMVTTGQIKK